jgi:hypothetical protein
VEAHLNGELRLGVYNLLPDGTCPWAMIECEDHGAQDVNDPARTSVDIVTYLRSHGIAAYRERSKNPSGNCNHIWIFFSVPISAFKLREGLRLFLQRTFGINVEVFPKGSKLDSIGNFVWLPLFGGTDTHGLGVNAGRTIFIDDQGIPYADQHAVIEGVEHNCEDAFYRFLEAYKITLPSVKQAARGKISYALAATADLAKVRECSFMKHCEEHAHHLPEPLWYAWITNAARCVGGRDYIHEYSSKDCRYSREETNRKIAHALSDTGPMTHETIAEIWHKCDCPAKFKAPISRSYWRDVDGEIKRIKAITDTGERAGEISSLMKYVMTLDPIERSMSQELLKKAFKLKNRDFDQVATDRSESEPVTPETVDYGQSLVGILEALHRANHDDTTRARVTFQWFKENQQASYFTDEIGQHYIYHEKKLIPMDASSSDFAGLLLYHGNISLATQPGRVSVQVMNAMAQLEGKRIKKNTWLQTDQKILAVYLNLKNERQELLKLTPAGFAVIPNGDNADGVFMLNTYQDKLKSLEFHSLSDVELHQALLKAEEFIVRHVPCKEDERWFTYAWWMTFPLFDFTTMHLITRAQGKSGQGKSTACSVLTTALYGEPRLDKSTVASLYSDASVNPLLVDDNMENRNFYSDAGRADFYLGAATGSGKQKTGCRGW